MSDVEGCIDPLVPEATEEITRRVSRRHLMVTPPMFAIPFGLVGLAGCWRQLAEGWTSSLADALAIFAAVILLLLAVGWSAQLMRRQSTLWHELKDPVRGPSIPVVAITAMLLCAVTVLHGAGAGRPMVAVFAVLTVLGGSAVVVAWLVVRLPLRAYHPGFYLPTAGGTLLTAQCAAQLGWLRAGEAFFFIGVGCWLSLGVVTTLRLLRAPLPPALRPVMVIELAAPALAGNTYLAVFGRFDAYAVALLAVTVVMAILQVVLIPYYRGAQFGPGSWSASFSYATTAALALRWIDHAGPAGAGLWRALTIALATGVVLQLTGRTVFAVRQGTFFPPLVPLEPAHTKAGHEEGS